MEIATPPGFAWHYFGTLESTNETAKAMADAGAADGTVVAAGTQTAGRGRYGRSWGSPPGNLYLSVVLRETGPAATRAQLSFVAAVGLGAAVSGLTPAALAVGFKWPNDVLVDGRKVAGLLLESGGGAADPWTVLGVGVNLVAHPAETTHPATDLAAAGAPVAAETLAARFLAELADWRARWRTQGFAPVRAAWLGAAPGRGGPVTVRLPGRSARAGTFVDLDEDGALVFRPDTGGPDERITAGEVFFPPAETGPAGAGGE